MMGRALSFSWVVALLFGTMCTTSQPSQQAVIPQPDTQHLSPAQNQFLDKKLKAFLSPKDTESVPTAEAWSQLGISFHGLDLRHAAKTAYETSLKFDPNQVKTHYLLGLLKQEMAELNAAITHFERVAELEPNYGPNVLTMADFYFKQNVYEKSTPLYQKALELNPGELLAMAGLAATYLEQKQYNQALNWAQKGLNFQPNISRLNYIAAMASRNLGQQYQATMYFEKSQSSNQKLPLRDPYFQAIQAISQRANILVQEALDLAQKGNIEEAKQRLKASIDWKPKNASAYFHLGRLAMQRGAYSQALEAFKTSSKIDPQQGLTFVNMGRIFLAQGMNEAAEQAYQKALRVGQNQVSVLLSTGDYARRQGNFQMATSVYQQGVEWHPSEWRLQMGLAICHIHNQAYSQAINQLEALIKKPRAPGPFYLMLARLLAASPQAELRDGARAFKIVEGMVEQGVNIQLLETGAMAQAEIGDFKKAEDWQKAAIELSSKSLQRSLTEALQARLRQYQDKKPTRVPFEPSDKIFTNPLG